MVRLTKCLAPWSLCIGLLLPAQAYAQIGFEALLGSITDVNLFFTCWKAGGDLQPSGSCPFDRNGYGVEVAFEIGRVPLRGSRPDTIRGQWIRASKQERRPNRFAVDSTVVYSWREGSVRHTRYFVLSLGLSYSQFTGFQSDDSRFEIRGAVRELPGLSLYATLNINDGRGLFTALRHISPYWGIRSGLIHLNNVQIYDGPLTEPRTVYSGTGTAFQVGALGGLVTTCCSNRVSFFVEGATHIRQFPNVQWAAAGTNRVPEYFPTDLTFTGPTGSIGVQFTIRDPR